MFQPNLFGHGHYATYDAVLNVLWVLAILAFARAVAAPETGTSRLSRWSCGSGVRPGRRLRAGDQADRLVSAAAVSGLGRRGPEIAARSRAGDRVCRLPVPCLFCSYPPWWTEPIAGVVRFFQSNLTRGQTILIPVQFLGTIYETPNESLPWYNTLAWTVHGHAGRFPASGAWPV